MRQQSSLIPPQTAPSRCHAVALLTSVNRKATGGYALRREWLARQWHARGQGFKSPQLHPRSEALFAVDRPRIARLRQQIGSNLP
jgi:hypothetical protein